MRSRWRGCVVVVILVAVAAPVAGCSAGDEPRADSTPSPSTSSAAPSSSAPAGAGLARFYEQTPEWADCRGDFECARVTVPVSYSDAGGETLELAVVRSRSAKNGDRVGSLLVNPGGPGGSGIDYARAATRVVSAEVRRRYDIVGFDPRGVGESSPVRCRSDEEIDDFVAADGSPDDAAETRRLVQLSQRFGRRCEQAAAEVLGHVGTRDVARDMDVLRAVVGDERLHYLGKSYGTYLGATYAELFPGRVGRLVLDGAIDPAASGADIAREQAIGFEGALAAFIVDCSRRSGCPLPAGRTQALRSVQRLLDDIDRTPLRGERGREVTQALAVLGMATALYDRSSWPILRAALGEARRGDGTTLLLLADFYTDRGRNGRYATNENDAIYAVNCLDHPEEGGVAAVARTADELRRVAPHFGPYIAWSALPCHTWPEPPTNSPHEIRAAGADPILVVGTTRDPATPYKWAQALAGQLESGGLLTYVGDGHTAYRQGNRCVDRAVDAYLLDGTMPSEGARCR